MNGEVTINDTLADITSPVDPEHDVVVVQGKELKEDKRVYLMINKPPGYLSTCKPGKEKGRSILDLVDFKERLYPVGRLDRESRGLLILTNDGKLAYKLSHPSGEVEKEYLVQIDRDLNERDYQVFNEGILIEGKLCRFFRIERLGKNYYSIILKQGYKRQIRKMIQFAGAKVIDLQRIREGSLTLDDLEEGKFRNLSYNEIKSLQEEIV